MFENIFGLLATISSLSLNVLGMPTQILKHYREKQVGLTAPFVILAFLTHIFWLSYGISIGSLPLIVSYSVGIVSNATVIVVYFMHDKSRK